MRLVGCCEKNFWLTLVASSTSFRSLKSASLLSTIGWKGSSIHRLTCLSHPFLPHHLASQDPAVWSSSFATLDGHTWQYSVKTILFSCDVIATMLILLLSLYGGLKVYQWEIYPPIWSACLTLGRLHCNDNYFECLCFRYASDISSVWSLQQTVQQTTIIGTCTWKAIDKQLYLVSVNSSWVGIMHQQSLYCVIYSRFYLIPWRVTIYKVKYNFVGRSSLHWKMHQWTAGMETVMCTY